jgi:hypothetical protein
MAKAKVPDDEVFEIHRARRTATPQLIGVVGPQFSGKTLSAIMLAAGLVKPGGKVGFLDTENGRGEMYADDPDVLRVLPQSYEVITLHPPFHPKRYISVYRQFERDGFDLVITDSASHAWEGDGGGLDIKEQEGAWNNAKLWNKRMMFALKYASMHNIVCLRMQEKTKIVGQGSNQQYIPLGMQPVCEKSFPYDVSLMFECEGEVDGKPATHLARPKKWPKAMNGLFNNWQPQLLTPEVGRRIREWNETAAAESPMDRLRKRARAAANEGTVEYTAFFNGLNPKAQKALIDDGTHSDNRTIAEMADAESRSDADETPVGEPDGTLKVA